jgi:transposase
VRSTWAPKGHTPILRHRFNWKRASMAAACCYQADASSAELVFGMRAGSYDEDSLIEFVEELHAHLAGSKVTLLWDGLPSHRSRKMAAYLASQRRWLVVERLPAYAPELNPVEKLWANLKGRELANLCAETLDEPIRAAQRGVERVRSDEDLLFGFLKAAGLSL